MAFFDFTDAGNKIIENKISLLGRILPDDSGKRPLENTEQFNRKDKVFEDSHPSDVRKDDVNNSDVLEGVPPESLSKIESLLETKKGLKSLIENHPEKAMFVENAIKALQIIEDDNATPFETRCAQLRLNQLKGELMELAVKDVLAERGLSVENHQHMVSGDEGGTKPDIVAVNNSDNLISALGIAIPPGETLSIECKCGSTAYITNQLKNHIPNQLSGHSGIKVLLTTSDLKDAPLGLAESVCNKYGANLVMSKMCASDAEYTFMEVAKDENISIKGF